MFRKLSVLLTLLLLGAFTSVGAQQRMIITGTVIADSLPLAEAAVTLNAADSTSAALRTMLTDKDGRFRIATRLSKPEVTVAYLGYKKFVRKVTSAKSGTVDLDTIRMVPDPIQTEGVTVQAKAPMAVIKGDTLQFNAAAFKTNPDATSEDLLKKMPGIASDYSGGLVAQGKKIEKVYVDGKDFFSDEPKMALKNLPAYTVKNIQIYDDKTEKAKFSGMDDGTRVKTVNIVTKTGVSHSTFGKAFGGYGTDSRYSAGAGAHIFRDEQRLTLTASTNNVNNQGDNLNEVSSMGSGGGMMGSYAMGGGSGQRTSRNFGLNYSGEFKKKLKLSSSYTFGNNQSENSTISRQDYLTMSRTSNDTSQNYSTAYSHNASLRAEWNPNETNRIQFRPRVSYTSNDGNSIRRQLTQIDGVRSNIADNRYRNTGSNYHISGDLSWMHRFKKKGRTLSVSGNFSKNGGDNESYQYSLYGSPDKNGIWKTDTIRQRNRSATPGYAFSGSVNYDEPISKSSRLSAGYDLSYNKSNSDRRGFNWNPATGDYSDLDTVTTNIFDRNQTRHNLRVGYGYNKKDFSVNGSLRYELTSLHDAESFPDNRTSRYPFDAFLPQLNLNWRISKLHSIGFNYNRYTQVPGVDQLQDVLDITNPLYVTTGNPDLRQSYSDNLSLYYNYYNQKTSFGAGLYAYSTFTADAIAYHRRFLTEDKVIQGITIPKGAQFTSPVNLSGNRNFSVNGNIYMAIKPIKCNLNLSLRYSYGTTPSIEDDITYRSRRHDTGLRIGLNSNISENVDFSLSYSPSLSFSTSGNGGGFERFLNNDLTGSFQITLWKGLLVLGDATWRNQTGSRDNYDQHYAIVNAGIGYKFLKFRQAEFRITGYDLLNQNRSYWQNTYDTYVQSTTGTVLRRYVLFSFSYTFDSRRKGLSDK